MKVVAINGSPRKAGNCAQLLNIVETEVKAAGVDFEILSPGADIRPCMACYKCLENDDHRCIQTSDSINEIIEKCKEADGIILASPVYHGNMSGSMKCIIDRLLLAGGCGSKSIFAHKPGAALCTVRRSGGTETYMQMLSSLASMDMILVTSDYWNIIHGADPGEAVLDPEGVEVAKRLGKNMAWMVKVLAATKEQLPPPESCQRTMTNFIR